MQTLGYHGKMCLKYVISSFVDSSGYASGPIKRCLFIGYIIIMVITQAPIYRVIVYILLCHESLRSAVLSRGELEC